jgi:hypothetical protein
VLRNQIRSADSRSHLKNQINEHQGALATCNVEEPGGNNNRFAVFVIILKSVVSIFHFTKVIRLRITSYSTFVMSSILIGSSNCARFYSAQNLSRFRPYTLARCTEFSSFVAIMEESTDKFFVISVIENFVSDRMRANPVGDVITVMEEVSNDFLGVVRDTANRLPDSKFGIVMPLQRPSLTWYQEEILTLRGSLERGLVSLKLDNVTRIDCISGLTQDFVDDKVHLTATSGKGFITFILSQAGKR